MTNKPLTILMADDDLEDLELFQDVFESHDSEVQLKKFTDGKKVLDYLDGTEDTDLPCLIVLDYNMPELNGSEVIAQLCLVERYKHIPKLILSTSNASIHIHECLNNGATAYFVKPNNLSDMEALIREMLLFCRNPGYDPAGR